MSQVSPEPMFEKLRPLGKFVSSWPLTISKSLTVLVQDTLKGILLLVVTWEFI